MYKPFLWGHSYSYFGLLVTSNLGYRARVDPLTCVLQLLYAMDCSHLPSGATPADLLMASMATKPFLIHLLAHVFTSIAKAYLFTL